MLKQGTPSGIILAEDGTPWQHVLDDKEQIVISLAYFFDLNPSRRDFANYPTAYERFQQLTVNIDLAAYSTVALDSLGSFVDCVVKADKYKFNATTKKGNEQHGMQHYAAASTAIRMDIMGTLCWAPTNFVCLVHTNTAPESRGGGRENVEGKSLYGFDAPGQLSMNLARSFSEIYHVHKQYDPKEKRERFYFQTIEDENYPAQTHVGCPNMCEAKYENIWSMYQ